MSDSSAGRLAEGLGRGFERPLWLAIAVAAAFFLNLGGLALFDLDEGAFSAATWEMFQRGDFITTYLNGEPRFDKPILIYWLQAASVSVLGFNEWGFRLPSALAASVWVYAVFAFAVPRLGRRAAVGAGVMTATALAVIVIGRAATADALLNLFITLIMLDAYRWIERPERTVLWRLYLWMGLGMLTKGPVAVAIPMIVSFLFFLSYRDLGRWLKAIINPVGWGIFLAVAGPWYVLEYLDQGQAFIDGFILKHNVGRFSDTMEGHGGHWYYYLVAILFVVMPYTGWLLKAATGLRAGVAQSFDRWMWIWFGFVLVFFSFSSTQLPHYVLYGTTPLFLLMAKYREVLRSRWLAYLPPVLFMSLLLFLPDIVGLAAARENNGFVRAQLEWAGELLGPGYRVGIALGLAATIAIAVTTRIPTWRGILGVGLIQVLLVVLLVGPAVAQVRQQPIKEAAWMSRDLDDTVVMWGLNMPSFVVYRGEITPQRRPEPGEVVVTRINKIDDLGEIEVLYEKGGIVLARLAQKRDES